MSLRFLLFSIVVCNSALACELNTDCAIGSQCVKESGELEGICVAGMDPGNRNDSRPYHDDLDLSGSVGNTCQLNTDCGVGAMCLKEAGQLDGVCVKRR